MNSPMLETITTSYGTFTVDTETDKKIAKGLRSGHHQGETLQLLEKFITKESTVVDVGAHIGTLTVPLARWAARTIAFEPALATYALLVQNIAQNSVIVDARNKGLGLTEGTASLVKMSDSNAGAQSLSVGEGSIAVSTLDNEVPHADLIKIDAEGMELDILRGGKELIAKSRPVVLFEVNLFQLRSHGTSVRALEHFFTAQGYKLYAPLGSTNTVRLGSVTNLSLLTAFVAPRSWAFKGPSAPFDILAIPIGREVPLLVQSFAAVLLHSFTENISLKMTRLKKLFIK